MDRIAMGAASDRRDLFSESASRLGMFYREPPDFATILAALPVLEEEMNGLS
jgi:hypothetical protein